MKRIQLTLSPEMLAAIDHARGDDPRNPFIEKVLRRSITVRRAAEELGVELPERERDGRRYQGGE